MYKSEKEIQISGELISGGINQVFDGSEWEEEECIGLCSDNSVLLYDLSEQRVRVGLTGHSKKVQCVRWLRFIDQVVLVTSSADGQLVQWRCPV